MFYFILKSLFFLFTIYSKEESKMLQKDYWNSVAHDKNFTTPFQSDLFAKYVAKDATILDIGCGYGRTLDLFDNLILKIINTTNKGTT